MNLESLDDALLLELIAAGRSDALEALYDRYKRLVFSVAFAIVGDGTAAEEVTLDVFVRVWRGAGRYRPERAKVSTWLGAITRHHAIDVLRWRGARASEESLERHESSLIGTLGSTGPEESLEATLERGRVLAALAKLPDDQRQALILAYFRGYTHEQIAERLHQPLGTVKTRIRIAMKKLRQLLSDEDEASDKSEGP
jgi:RNA polymerase sigma-70 factor, ECF subfamily